MKIILIAALLLPLPALACGAGEKPVFSCTTTKGKEIKVCQAPTAIKYSFGKPGQPPELTLSESNKTFLYEVDGGSASEYQTFTFKNGKTHYVLNNLSNFSKIGLNGEIEIQGSEEASLEVTQGGKSLATLECKQSTIDFDRHAITVKPKRPSYDE